MANSGLDALSLGFRERFLNHDDIAAQLAKWQSAHPQLVRVETIGTTAEGRAMLVAVIGPDRCGDR